MEEHSFPLGWKNQYCENDYQKPSTDLMQSLSNYNGIFHTPRTKTFTISMQTQTMPNNQSNLEKRMELGRINLLDFRLCTKATVIKTEWYLNNRKIDQWNKTESPHTYGHLLFDKGNQNIQWEKGNLFNKCY